MGSNGEEWGCISRSAAHAGDLSALSLLDHSRQPAHLTAELKYTASGHRSKIPFVKKIYLWKHHRNLWILKKRARGNLSEKIPFQIIQCTEFGSVRGIIQKKKKSRNQIEPIWSNFKGITSSGESMKCQEDFLGHLHHLPPHSALVAGFTLFCLCLRRKK